MTGATAPGWVIGGTAYLTASAGTDTVGDGWLRLTDVAGNQAGFAFFDSAFNISAGVVISFDYATWGGAGDPDGAGACPVTGADGYSIYLFDGSYNASTFSPGASGGSLGYAQKTAAPFDPGITGGYLGIGIDEWGNFSNPSEGRVGGPGLTCNGVAVRGPTNNDPTGVTGYNYIGGTAAQIATLSFPGYQTRPSQSDVEYRKVVIYLTPVGSTPVTNMRIDVYMQVGYTSALTQVLSGLMLGSGPPNNGLVKIGYAASTGGSTNIHEIRNLVIDPLPSSNIDLGITKLASSSTVVTGGTITYTVKVQNYGPTNVTAPSVTITDAVPAAITGVKWSCSGAGGAVCSAATGTGNNINTTVTLPLNSAATYTISGTVTAASGTQLTNTATLTVPGGINDYNTNNNSASAIVSVVGAPVTITGRVCNDANRINGCEVAEAGANIAAVYAKLFRSSNLTTALSVTTVAQTLATGPSFTFTNVPSFDTYTIILSSTSTSAYDPSFPNANWIYTTPVNYTISNVSVGAGGLMNQNFGVYTGSRIAGKVIRDNGFNGALANANDGVLNAAETGIAGVQMRLALDTAPTGTLDSVLTDSSGNFALFTNNTSTQLRIYETNPSGYISVNYNPGTTAGAYTIATDYISFAYTQYTDYSGVLFGDVQDNTFAANQAKNGMPSNTVYYAHTFTPGSGGTVTFAQNSRITAPAAPAWAAAGYYRDTNCNGTYDAGDTAIVGALTASANVPICILTAVAVPATATAGTTDALITRATFSFINSLRPANSTYDVTDTTTVVMAPNLSTSTKTVVDLNGGDALPNDVLRYTISVKETAGVPANGVTVTDNIPANVTGFTVVSFSSGTNSSTGAGTGSNGTGYLNITNFSIASNGTATIVFDVTIAAGTPAGTVINNTATVTPSVGLIATPAAQPVVVGPFVSISGRVCNDANHINGCEAAETGANIAGVYAKLFRSSNLTTALLVTTVTQTLATGLTFTFTNVPSSDTYTIILSSTSTSVYDPSFPNANWTYTSPVNYILSNVVVALANIGSQNFGVYNGSRINGMVLKDDGGAVGFASANDSIQNAAEAGIAGVQVKIALNSAPTGTLDIATTDGNGAFILYTNTATAALRITEVANPAGYVSVNFNAGNTGGTYTPANDYILFNNYTLYTDYSGIVFSDVPDNTFTPTTQALSSAPSTTVYYAHTFTPGSGGSVSFAQNARITAPAAPVWPAVVYYQDNNCNGAYDGGDTVLAGALNTTRGTAICVLARVVIPTGAVNTTTDTLTTRATFTYTNSIGPVVRTYDVTDTTTVTASDLSTSAKSWTDMNGGDQNPNDILQYTISIVESLGNPASGVTVTDTFPATLTNLSVVTCPAGATCGFAGQMLTVSSVTVTANGTANIIISSTIAGGTAVGTLINNCATITNLSGVDAAPCAGTVTVSASAIPGQGNKPLYVYGAGGGAPGPISRSTAGNTAVVTIGAATTARIWTQDIPMAIDMSLQAHAIPANDVVPVNLYMSCAAARTGNIRVDLTCGTITLTQTQSVIFAVAGTIYPVTFNLPYTPPQTCTQGNSWTLTITNTGINRVLTVYPVSAGNTSRINLPSASVISVGTVTAYIATYPSVTSLSSFTTGTVYLRSKVTDPFGSADIASATITIQDPASATKVSVAPMTVVASDASSKTFEYAYLPVPPAVSGFWNTTVIAQEGLVTEGTPTDKRVGTFRVDPSLLLVKSAQALWDPINLGVSPKIIPGSQVVYTLQLQNSSYGSVDSNSLVFTDAIPANTIMCTAAACYNTPVQTACITGPCGLTFAYPADVTYSCSSLPCPNPDANGWSANVTSISINPKSALNGTAVPATPIRYNILFKVKIN
jgi:uncharacterized repeat protein (TIGR01451 family)